MQFREFVDVVRSRWRIIVATVLLALAAAVALTVLTPAVYTAQARIYLSTEGGDRGDNGRGVVVLSASDLDTYVSILNTPAVLDPLREELGLPDGYPVDVSASVTDSTSILDITARAGDAQEAADVANEVGPQLSAVAGKFSTLLAASGQTVVSTPIQPATAPSSPTTPDPVRNVAVALLAGLVLGIGLALLRHALDSRVRGEEDIRTLSDAPVLAVLPLAHQGKSEAVLSIDKDPYGAHAEAIRRLRTNLLFVDVTTGRHSFVVTSAMPGEGKTTTAVNLALAMADAGSRTLLIDADLRSPSVARMLGLEGSVGLTTILLGGTSAAEAIQQWGGSSLHVLAAGEVPPNPSELLGSRPMQDLFHELQGQFDFILVDSPPVVPVIDAVVIERLTGGLLMVVGAGTRKRDLANAMDELKTVDAKVSGFARNFVAGRQGGEYRYGYHRYDEGRSPGRPDRRERRSSVRADADVK